MGLPASPLEKSRGLLFFNGTGTPWIGPVLHPSSKTGLEDAPAGTTGGVAWTETVGFVGLAVLTLRRSIRAQCFRFFRTRKRKSIPEVWLGEPGGLPRYPPGAPQEGPARIFLFKNEVRARCVEFATPRLASLADSIHLPRLRDRSSERLERFKRCIARLCEVRRLGPGVSNSLRLSSPAWRIRYTSHGPEIVHLNDSNGSNDASPGSARFEG